MNTPIVPRDLSKQAPHSPRKRLGGFVIAARAVDKCLASAPGEYHFDCPLDNVLFSFKNISAAEFKAAAVAAKTYEEMGFWLLDHGMTKTPEEIEAWSDQVEASSLMNKPDSRDYFIENCYKLELDPKKTTTFDWLEVDDRVSFSSGTQ